MEAIEAISIMMGAAWASGINLYATILVLGWMGNSGQMDLPPDLQLLAEPSVMLAAGGMYCIEFFADKIPGVDSGWDAIHTFIRIPAGAMLAAGASQGLDMGAATELVAMLLGGGLAAASHTTKAGSRLLINMSPEPVTNWTASVVEDVAVVGGLWAALNHPIWFLIALAIFIALVIWLLPKIWRALKRAFKAIKNWFSHSPKEETQAESSSSENSEGQRKDALKELYHKAEQDSKST